MPAPLVVGAAAAAAKLIAKKVAKDAAKKIAVKSNAKAVKASRKSINKEVKVIQNANARGLKAAQGKSLASPIKKSVAKKNDKERAMVKRLAEANKGLNMKEPYATKDAMLLADRIRKSKKSK
jgi:uncharacterized membrane protein YheB (UPF0754 family)